MRLRHSVAALLASSLVRTQDTCTGGNSDLTVRTSSGAFKGFVDPEAPNVNTWLGIPYGAPPINDKRFMPPEPANYSGAHNATTYKPICFQDSKVGEGVFWELVPQFQNTDPQSEDCLYLNIWGPRKPVDSALATTDKVPVIIWVCGGGFNEGGAHAPYQVPNHWVQRMQTHIFVTFNVEWVRDNIEAFGGLIADSGYAAPINTVNYTAFSKLGGYFGCGGLSSKDELACMQKVDPHDIQNLLQGAATSGNTSVPSFGPVAEGLTVYANNTERMNKGLVANVPLIAENNINEGAAFAPFSLNETVPPPASELQTGLTFIACPVKNEVNLRVLHGLPTYRYLFAGNFSNITPRYWLGAMHSSELPIIFGTHYEFRGNSTELEWLTSYAMEALWDSFAQDSAKDPTDGMNVTWPKYSTCGNMLLFAKDGQPVQIVPGNSNDAAYMCT